MLCIPEAAARRWVAGCSEQERGWLPRRQLESWLGLMEEVRVLRLPLAFGRAHADLTLSEGGAVVTKGMGLVTAGWRAAASKAVMRSGCHFVWFTVVGGFNMVFGVIRPGWDVDGGRAERVQCGRPLFLQHVRGALRTPPASPATTTGRGGSPRWSTATALACCSTSIRAA